MRQAFRSVLILSAGLNLVLAVSLVRGPSPVASKARPTPVALGATSPEGKITATNSAPTVTFVTNRFDWRQIESKDYDQFVANLRAVGCPESTLRDIVLAEVRKTYSERAATVALEADFWTGGARRAAALRAREKTRRSLTAEKKALLSRLLGSDLEEEDDHGEELVREAITRFMIGAVPERAYRQVPALLQKSEDQANELKSGGLMLPEDLARLRELGRQTLAELQVVLTPDQFNEFALRSAIMNHAENALEEIKVSAADWRQIAGLCLEVYGLLDRSPFGEVQENPEVSRDKLFQDGLKRILGEGRYREYEREKDPGFQAAASVAEQNQLPRETAIKVYEIRQLLEAESRRLGDAVDSEVPPQLDALQAASRAEIRKLLGEKAYQALLSQGNNAWLTNSVAR